MKVEIPYGEKNIQITIDEPCKVLAPNKVSTKDENELIKKALEKPYKSISFEEFAKKSKQLLIIVNDGTRPTPTAKILDFLKPILTNHPNIKFIVACGSHKPPSEKELNNIFGKYYKIYKDKIFIHDAKKEENLRYAGTTKKGTQVYFNKIIYENKNIVTINSVEPHYFAGYTGGRKSFLPGIASYKTIEMNHKNALNKKSSTLALKGNPVHDDMIDSLKFLKNINVFSIQLVLTPEGKIYKATTGDLIESFNQAIKYANEIFCVPLKEKGNIVITAAPPPMDVDLYQSQKALENGKLALEKNGIIILVSQCPNGPGDKTFLDLLSKAKDPKQVLKLLEEGYKLGYHKSAKIAELATWADIWAVTSLDETTVKKAFMKPYSDIQPCLNDAIKTIKNRGKKPNIIVMPAGSLTVPLK